MSASAIAIRRARPRPPGPDRVADRQRRSRRLRRPTPVNWENLVKRYVWDDDRTPYLVPASRITRRQADYEIYAYTVFLGDLVLHRVPGSVVLRPPRT